MDHGIISIFMHIPKTGGTTLNEIFKQQYNNNEIYDHQLMENIITNYNQLSKVEKENIKAISGHHFYGIHEHFPNPINYFTLLRDPVDRVISLYYFLQTYEGYEEVKGMTLEEYVTWDLQAQNGQTHMAGGTHINPSLERAIENLKKFKVVGITEMFDESLFLLKKEFGWDNISYTKQNVTKKRLMKEEVPSATINLIKKYNALDIELYEFAKQLFIRKFNSLSSAEQIQLEQFKQEQRLRS